METLNKEINSNKMHSSKSLNAFHKIDIENKPKDVSISTMTLTCKLDVRFNAVSIAKYIDLKKNGIVSAKCGKMIERSIIPKKPSSHKTKGKKKNFYNQATLRVKTKIDNKLINMKLFLNGSIQMTGCKSVEGTIEALDKLFDALRDEKAILSETDFKITDIPFVSDRSKLDVQYLREFKIAMINSNFTIPRLQIDRDNLYECMADDDIDVSYDSEIHAGVIVKYPTPEKVISIFIFESGSIVITGARACKQIADAYDFINRYLLRNYNKISKSDIITNEAIYEHLGA